MQRDLPWHDYDEAIGALLLQPRQKPVQHDGARAAGTARGLFFPAVKKEY
ncbi:Uncharacterised protein [Bordetella pertussis]|nr:Uncharacterised protein [Bordetella pertussis]